MPNALVIFGSTSRLGADSGTRNKGIPSYQAPGTRYSPLSVPASAFDRHLVAPNGGRSAFDAYVFSWQPFLRREFSQVYEHGFASFHAVFEDNGPHQKHVFSLFAPAPVASNAVGQISMSYAISRSAMMVLQDENGRRCGNPHKRVVFVRPDLMLFQDIAFHSAEWRNCTRTVHLGPMIPSSRYPSAYSDSFFLVGHDGLQMLSGVFVGNTIAQAGGEVLASHHWLHRRASNKSFKRIPGDVQFALYRDFLSPSFFGAKLGFSFLRDTYNMTEEQRRHTAVPSTSNATLDQLLDIEMQMQDRSGRGHCCKLASKEATAVHQCCIGMAPHMRSRWARAVECGLRALSPWLEKRIADCPALYPAANPLARSPARSPA